MATKRTTSGAFSKEMGGQGGGLPIKDYSCGPVTRAPRDQTLKEGGSVTPPSGGSKSGY